MISTFADIPSSPDPLSFYFTQGILGVTVIALIIVIRFMWNYFTNKLDAKDLKIEALQNARLEDNKANTADYREMSKNDQSVMSGISTAQQLLAAKIEAVKGNR